MGVLNVNDIFELKEQLKKLREVGVTLYSKPSRS